ncbi:MAG: histidine kinase, partial [Chloroflexi bacterium]|nr:histidine kinase [Chloroflexota bacterium]
MLKRLRWQLAVLYALAALGLVAAVVAGSFVLLNYYFRYTTDLALQYRMAQAFQQYGLSVPADLLRAQEDWLAAGTSHTFSLPLRPGGRDHDGEAEEHEGEDGAWDADYDAQLASVFVLPLSAEGQVDTAYLSGTLAFTPDAEAARAALEDGRDWRTVRLANGSRLRLLTYRTQNPSGPAVFQAGRLLNDQDRVFGFFLVGLSLLGGAVFVFLGLGGWWISGRTIGPAQRAWDQQQAFVSNASHELRTPLTILRATAELQLRLGA